MKLEKETINGVDYVRKEVLVRLFDELYKGSVAEAVKTGEFVHYSNAGAMMELRELFKVL